MPLTLGRTEGESIIIGDSITVTITRIDAMRVHVRVDAPDDVAIDRAEVRARKLADGRNGIGARTVFRRDSYVPRH